MGTTKVNIKHPSGENHLLLPRPTPDVWLLATMRADSLKDPSRNRLWQIDWSNQWFHAKGLFEMCPMIGFLRRQLEYEVRE